MNALRKVIDRDELKQFDIPLSFGKKLEIIILPYTTEVGQNMEQGISDSDSYNLMKLQEKSGFLNNLYNDPEEDVWNNV